MFGNISRPSKIDTSRCGKEKFTHPETNQAVTKGVAFQAFDSLKNDAFNRVYQHEKAHQQAGGSQAGSIFIDYDSNGVAQGGHVDITLPKSVNKENPQETLTKATTAYDAALAPGDPSGQDLSVASMAMSIMGLAQLAMGIKNNNQAANTPFDRFTSGQKFNMMA
jgi:hypothetical protein